MANGNTDILEKIDVIEKKITERLHKDGQQKRL